jgi:hypothetical protein
MVRIAVTREVDPGIADLRAQLTGLSCSSGREGGDIGVVEYEWDSEQ